MGFMGHGPVSEGAVVELRERLVATVSHEFRTPLNGIVGMADVLMTTPAFRALKASFPGVHLTLLTSSVPRVL